MSAEPEAVVVGSGPNGLAAAITLARAGLAVRLYEAAAEAGGGLRSAEPTGPGVVHDRCASVLALLPGSPFFRSLDFGALGVRLVRPELPLAHVIRPDEVVLVEGSVAGTAARLGPAGAGYRRLLGPLVSASEELFDWVLGRAPWPPSRPRQLRHLGLLLRFGLPALAPASFLARAVLDEREAAALFGGLAAHGLVPLDRPGSAVFGLVLGVAAHAGGWPFVAGGSQRLADALVAELRRLGGEMVAGTAIRSWAELPRTRAVLLDLAPRQVVGLLADRLPPSYRARLARFRHGPGVCKVDWTLDGPIPWRDPDLARAGTVHLGGTLAEIEATLRAVNAGRLAERPFVVLVQPGRADPSRAPRAREPVSAYSPVPSGHPGDLAPAIEAAVEAAAPGFRDRILARVVTTAVGLERENPNLVGGDIGGGAHDLGQLVRRPTLGPNPYRTPLPGVYLCSASTPPGGGVHGMAGWRAARLALRETFGRHLDG